MDGLRQDLRYALRTLRTTPGYTAFALLTVALGTGARTAVFSMVNGVLLRWLPYSNGDRVVRPTMPVQLHGRGDPQRAQTGVVSDVFFDLVGVQPLLGRLFKPGEDAVGAPPVVGLS
jgi:hypothetical protein